MKDTQNQHAGATSIDIGAIPFLKQFLGVKNLLDIGCGPGGNVEYARSRGIDAYGLDGDVNTIPNKPYSGMSTTERERAILKDRLILAKKFSENGFEFDADLTKVIRDVSKPSENAKKTVC